MRYLLLSLSLLALAACEQVDKNNIPAENIYPSEALYQQINPHPPLAHSFSVGSFTYAGANEAEFIFKSKQNWLKHLDLAVEESLKKAKLLAKNQEKARYIISGEVKDFNLPNCLYGSCDGGSAINYSIEDKKGRVLWQELVVVPYTEPVAFSIELQPHVMWDHSGRVLSENVAHMVHVLSTKTTKDFN